ncbi:serine/threonine/tyrosine-interacting-like protein 1 isoform X2 [Dysidea avara]|uniref:serine/threonine/tyrosine-interacting-like protein 1 isoform X2 n=1 Tax=Dysidea avara TaxID=196820 RepID=UPI003325C600
MESLVQSVCGEKGLITCHELYNKLNDGVIHPYVHDPGYMLLIDVRLQDCYLASHILVAKQWKIIQNDVRCLLNPSGFLEEFTFVIVYDESSKSDNASQDVTEMLSMLESHGCTNPLVLNGGYQEFLKQYPFLCLDRQYFSATELETFKTYPSVIIPGKMYLGNWRHAANKTMLDHLRVSHIVNLTLDDDELFSGEIKYMTVRINDSVDTDAYSHFTDVVDFVGSAWDSGCILIHCKVGVSRSTTFALAFLMSKYECSLLSASNLVKICRAGVWPNETFVHHLLRWEKDLFKKEITKREDVWR